MQFVDEEDDLALGVGDLFEERLEPVLEFAPELGPGKHGADVHRDDLLVFERFRNIAADDPTGEPFDNGRLTHPRLADEHRVVLGAPREDLHDAADFVVAADDRVDFAASRHLGEVAPVFFQRLVFRLGILVGDALGAAHLLERLHEAVFGDACFFEVSARSGFAVDEGQEEMFRAQELVLHARHFLLGGFDGAAQFVADEDLHRALDARTPGNLGLEFLLERGNGDTHFIQQRAGHAFALVEQGEEQLLVVEFGDSEVRRRFLRRSERLLHFGCQFVQSHKVPFSAVIVSIGARDCNGAEEEVSRKGAKRKSYPINSRTNPSGSPGKTTVILSPPSNPPPLCAFASLRETFFRTTLGNLHDALSPGVRFSKMPLYGAGCSRPH